MNCSKCPNGNMVYTSGGVHVECAAILAMDLSPSRPGHRHGVVMVYMGKFFFPKECPNPAVPVELKVEFDARKTQPCRDAEGTLIPRVSKRRKS